MFTKDLAICIRVTDYSETSQIVVFFTRLGGKISAIAKGAKRAKSSFGGPIELFSSGRIVYKEAPGSGLATLTEFDQHGRFSHLSNDYFAMNCALFVAELMNCSTDDHDPHPELFDSVMHFFINGKNAKGQSDNLVLLILFQLSLLREMGLQPVLNSCVNCKRAYSDDWPETYFSSSANGVLCRDCDFSFPDRIRITPAVGRCLTNLGAIASAQLKTLIEVEKLLVNHFRQTMARDFKMAKYILQ